MVRSYALFIHSSTTFLSALINLKTTEGPCITRILGLRKTRVKQISRYVRTWVLEQTYLSYSFLAWAENSKNVKMVILG